GLIPQNASKKSLSKDTPVWCRSFQPKGPSGFREKYTVLSAMPYGPSRSERSPNRDT
ncbi:Hypothetical protein FKW44_000596, partial [Caligus rogercresseyi]